MDQANNFINAEDTILSLIELRNKELKQVDRKGNALVKGPAREKADKRPCNRRKEETSSKSAGY